MLIKYLLNGKEINLTGDDVIITSNNFNVDKGGNMSCNNATINKANIVGGTLNLTGRSDDAVISISNEYEGEIRTMTVITPYRTEIKRTDDSYITTIRPNSIRFEGENSWTEIQSVGVMTPGVIQHSLEEYKKNFEKFENGLEIVKNTEIYKYNLNNEVDGSKKHIGFVIGNKYKYCKDITSKDNSGVDLYSMISVAYKAIQEQQEEIEKLKKLVEEK